MLLLGELAEKYPELFLEMMGKMPMDHQPSILSTTSIAWLPIDEDATSAEDSGLPMYAMPVSKPHNTYVFTHH